MLSWLKPYNKHKLDAPFRLCIFLGYSLNQSAYKCYDPNTQKIFIFCHVVFDESEFPLRPTFTHENSLALPNYNVSNNTSCPR